MVREHILLILMHLIKCAYADPSVRGHARLRQCPKHLCVCVCVCVCARALVSRYAHSCARTCMHISDASPLLSLSSPVCVCVCVERESRWGLGLGRDLDIRKELQHLRIGLLQNVFSYYRNVFSYLEDVRLPRHTARRQLA